MAPVMNWEDHYLCPVRCRVAIRPEYKGRPMKPGIESLNGQELLLEPLWLMGADDPYPGEWALGPLPTSEPSTFAWIASGDVVPLS